MTSSTQPQPTTNDQKALLLLPMTTPSPLTNFDSYFSSIVGTSPLEIPIMSNEGENKSPPHGFSHDQDILAEETKEAFDLAILADAASKSPVPESTGDETLDAPAAGIPLPLDSDSKPKAKKASKTKAKVDLTPKKRSTRTRKLPTKLQQTPPPTPPLSNSASSAMSAAAILVQVSGGAEKPKKKSRPRKPKASPKDAPTAAKTPTTPKDGGDLRGITMKRPGKWQAQFYYAGQSRYIGIFSSQEKAAQAYEIVRQMLKTDAKPPADTPREAFEISRKAAFDGVGEKLPDGPKKMTPMLTPPKRKRGPQKRKK